MSKKGMSTQGKVLAGLTVLSVGLFGYQNIYVPNFEMEKEAIVYVARDDIPAYTEVDATMFQGVSITERSVVPGSVTNIASVDGKKLSGTLKKGELLSTARLTDDAVMEGELLTEVKIESNLPLKDNDNIRIFKKYQGEGGKFIVEELFDSKKVFTKNTVFGVVEESASQSQGDGMKFYLKLDQEEVLKYEEAISTGQIIAVKIIGDEAVQATKGQTESETETSGQTKLVSDKEPIQTEDNRGTVQYTVKEGEDLSGIAETFFTSESKLREMNDGITDVEAGDKILVPAI